eukprot:TRINITY_DN19434_c0_g1_i1.p1 TRINITY_DN19434_c0_g1~~TRINITY_DN19434_c0_g1_i1.p1  ORF type:complete len:1734 (-),score=325.80 TRINITY_DN19434_c0_g1_i1:231-5432(-)
MESGLGGFIVQLVRLLDVPSADINSRGPARYVVRALEADGRGDRVVGESREVTAPSPPGGGVGRSTVVFGPDGALRVRTNSDAIILRVEFARSGDVVGSCRIHRMDERSSRVCAYALERNGEPANCGVELRVEEEGPRDARLPWASQGLPRADAGGAAPFVVHVKRLLDVPCRYSSSGGPIGYIVRAVANEQVVAATGEIHSGARGDRAEVLNVGADLHCRTSAPVVFMHVEYIDGAPLGRCHIDRRDPRSPVMSPYSLSDARGSPVHCGIELAVADPTGGTFGGPDGPGPSGGRMGCGGFLPHGQPGLEGHNGRGPAGNLQVRVVRGYNLRNRDTGLFGDKSDPFVVLRMGRCERRTPPIANDLNPVWSRDNLFTMPVGEDDGMLDVEVVNSNNFKNNSLGTTSVGLWLLQLGHWTKLRERLTDGGRGEIELDVRFDPAPQMSQLPPPGSAGAVAPFGAVPPAYVGAGQPQVGDCRATGLGPLALMPPQHPDYAGAAGSCGSGGCGAPMNAWLSHAPPPYAVPGRTPQRPVERLTPLPLAGALPLEPAMPEFEIDDDWVAEALPRELELEPLAPPPPESFLDPAAELWAHDPPPSALDDLFGLDMDDEVLEETAEPWRAPVMPNHEPLFQDQVFPDMDVRILLRKEGQDSQAGPGQRKDHGKAAQRKKEQLPEFSLSGWVEVDPLKPKAKQKPLALQGPPQLTVGGRQAASAGKAGATAASTAEQALQRRRWKLRIERELVQPEMIESLWRQCGEPGLAQPDDGLQPTEFDVQVIGSLGAEEEPGLEKQVWLRTPSELRHPGDDDGWASWLKAFETEELSVGVTCRRGSRGEKDPLPNQDSFSMTRSQDISLFIVCDGHGPFGHFAAFRVAQSLPKYVLDGLHSRATKVRPEHVLVQAFETASKDLMSYAHVADLDFSMSGTSCAVLLMVGSDVQVAWLGDSRALVGTLPPDVAKSRLDFASPAHVCEDDAEAQRLRAGGADVRLVPAGPGGRPRIFAPGGRTPCLLTTRALGDSGAKRLGLAVQPDVKKMSFARTPGVVLLASGGLWDAFDVGGGGGTGSATGESILAMLGGECALGKKGPETAARRLGGRAKDRWNEAADGCSDDSTAIILQWKRPTARQAAATAKAVARVARGVSTASAVSSAPTAAPPSPQAAAATASAGAASTAVPAAMPSRQRLRLKPVVLEPPAALGESVAVQTHLNDPELVRPFAELEPNGFLAQVCSCLDDGAGGPESDQRVWFRLADGGAPEELGAEAARARFAAAEAQARQDIGGGTAEIAFCSRRGLHNERNADAFSMTLASGGRSVYVVCDGHGPLGSLVAFRVAQCLPKSILEGLDGAPASDEKDVAIRAFDAVSSDLVRFGEERGIDMRASGTTAALALRQKDKVLVCWLGDSRALVATVVAADRCRVDLMAKPHSPADQAELHRLQKFGLKVRTARDAAAPLRIFVHDDQEEESTSMPGLSVSRTFGDLSVAGKGVTSSPDLARTSFESMPGLVLLGTGGLCEAFDDGDAMLDGLLQNELLRRGSREALELLCSNAQSFWQQENDLCEDVTGLLLHWPPTAGQASTSAAGLQESVSSPGSTAQQDTRYQPRVVPIERKPGATHLSAAVTSASNLAMSTAARKFEPRVVPIQRQVVNAAQDQSASRQFLQARPRHQVQSAPQSQAQAAVLHPGSAQAGRQSQTQQRFLQAQPLSGRPVSAKILAVSAAADVAGATRRQVPSLSTVLE